MNRYNSVSAVDYSAYYYKGSTPTRHIKAKGSKKKWIIITVAAILTIAVFFCVNFALSGLPIDALKGFFGGKSYSYYYAVMLEKASSEEAYAYALAAKQGGAAGCVKTEKEKYFVVLSMFLISEEAEAVAKKNNAVVKKITLWEDESYDVVKSSVERLLSTAENLEKGTVFEVDVLETYAIVKAEAITLKQQAIEKKTELPKLNMLIGGLNEETVTEGTKHEILSEMRYVAFMMVSGG